MSCKDYLFRGDDNLEYIASDSTFDKIYQEVEDPWGQNNKNDEYYNNSRKIIGKIINDLTENDKIDILEIGCGDGISTYDLKKRLNKNKISFFGCDISKIAVQKASKKYNNINFFYHNIKDKFKEEKKYDIIIISNLLWYILEHLEVSFNNCFDILKENGKLVFYNAFMKEQRYGKEIIDGHDGMKFFLKNKFPDRKIVFEFKEEEKKDDHRYLGALILS